jgi:hypothetical protein
VDFRPAYEALATRLGDDLRDVLRSPVSRKNLPAGAFKPKDQPALVVLETGFAPLNDDAAPLAWKLDALLVLHSKVGADEDAPGASLMTLIAAVEAALRWRPSEPPGDDGYSTTLGGTVWNAKLGPVTITDDEEQADQVTTLLQVSMTVANN